MSERDLIPQRDGAASGCLVWILFGAATIVAIIVAAILIGRVIGSIA